jgi:hypothetical protein
VSCYSRDTTERRPPGHVRDARETVSAARIADPAASCADACSGFTARLRRCSPGGVDRPIAISVRIAQCANEKIRRASSPSEAMAIVFGSEIFADRGVEVRSQPRRKAVLITAGVDAIIAGGLFRYPCAAHVGNGTVAGCASRASVDRLVCATSRRCDRCRAVAAQQVICLRCCAAGYRSLPTMMLALRALC